MAKPRRETPLGGGNTNPGVVRTGDTVRRATRPHSKRVHELLLHLERKGFAEAPRFLGIDEKGREILSYIDGDATIPDTLWTEAEPLIAASRMLRRYHSAIEDFESGSADEWAYAYPVLNRREVLCHNDFAPYNMLFRDGIPIGIVDFDLAGPGPRLRDLAYLAYWMVPLSFSSPDLREHSQHDLKDGSPRLRMIRDTYGVVEFEELVDTVAEVLHHMGSEEAAIAMVSPGAAKRLKEGGHFTHWQNEARQFSHYRGAILENCRDMS